MAAPTDPLYTRQWHLSRIGAPAVWEDYTGRGVDVGIFDFDGADYAHYELDANADPDLNLVYNGTAIDPTTAAVRNHGTSVAGVISGERNGTGIVGVAYDSRFAVVPLIFNGNSRDAAYFGAAMAHQAAFDVTNMSWNFQPFSTGPGSALWQSIKGGIGAAALAGRDGLGTVMVATPSNDRKGDQWHHGPGDANAAGPHSNDRHVVVVGGFGENGVVADYSAPGASLLVSAPAQGRWSGSTAGLTGIWTTDRVGTAGFNDDTTADGGDFVETVGTSFAAPIVAGVVALMLEANPDLGWRDVREILALSARHTGSALPAVGTTAGSTRDAERYGWQINDATNWNGGGMHFSNDYGFGRVDARAAVRFAESWTTLQTSLNEAHVSAIVPGAGGAAIPDGTNQPLLRPIVMASGIDIETMTLTLGLNHTSARELVILLTSPSGTTSVLIANPADDIDINGWEFTSNAFAGEDSGGTWILQIFDTIPSNPMIGIRNFGFITSGELHAYGSRASQDDTYFYTDEFNIAGRIGDDPARATLTDTAGIDTINAAAVNGGLFIFLSGTAPTTIAGRALTLDGFFENAVGGDGDDYLYGNDATNILTGGRGADQLFGVGGHDILRGGAGADRLTGGQGSDSLYGEADSDELSGGLDADRLHGGFADEVDSEGVDGNDTLLGLEGDDTLVVSYGNDRLDGGQDRDTLSFAWMGADLTIDLGSGRAMFQESGNDFQFDADGGIRFGSVWVSRIDVTWSNMENLTGGGGDDRLTGDANANRIIGGFGNDRLTGGAGADELFGGPGTNMAGYITSAAGVTVNLVTGKGSGGDAQGDTYDAISEIDGSRFDDTFVLDAAANTVYGEGGNDTVDYRASTAAVTSGLFFGRGSGGYAQGDALIEIDNLIGSIHDDVLTGSFDSNRLDGWTGADTMSGYGADDVYVVDNAGDKVVEMISQGVDLVRSSVSYNLGGQYVENLTLTGTGAIDATGNSLANGLVGNDGANRLDGGAGADVMRGGLGNDTYVVDEFGDRVFEFISQGVDLVLSSVSFNLGGQYIENLTLTGTGAASATGNSFANTLVGNASANTLSGSTGDDVLNGAGGNDLLNGGAGRDTFSFTTVLGTGNVDRIADFLAVDDSLRLARSVFTTLATGALSETAFKDLSTGAADAGDRILYDKATGGLSYDADGGGTAFAAVRFAILDNKAAITHLDVLVV